MRKKINCKHGLTEAQELEARKLRKKLAESDMETLKLFRDMFDEYIKDSKGPYIEYVRNKNLIYYSALMAEMERIGPQETYKKILSQ